MICSLLHCGPSDNSCYLRSHYKNGDDDDDDDDSAEIYHRGFVRPSVRLCGTLVICVDLLYQTSIATCHSNILQIHGFKWRGTIPRKPTGAFNVGLHEEIRTYCGSGNVSHTVSQ